MTRSGPALASVQADERAEAISPERSGPAPLLLELGALGDAAELAETDRLRASLHGLLRRALTAYNRAWSRRTEPDGQAALSAARLDVLLLLAQDSEPLEPQLIAQLALDARAAFDLAADSCGVPELLGTSGQRRRSGS